MARYTINCRDYELPEINISIQDYIIGEDIEFINTLKRQATTPPKRWYQQADRQQSVKLLIQKKLDKLIQNTPCLSLVNRCKINTAKTRIETYQYMWDKIKILSNPYERIYMTSSKYITQHIQIPKSHNIDFEPLSRSYFKMIEMARTYLTKLMETPKHLTTLHLAEGPGGFIEAFINLRKKYRQPHDIFSLKDSIYAMTLIDPAEDVPAWKRSVDFLRNNPEIKIVSGVDETGNLYNSDNIRYLKKRLSNNRADLITADGGFDFSMGYNSQEFLACKLILAEILACFASLERGGCFICKFFDLNSKLTVDMLYILQCYFTNIDITKPITSRPANSEKYIICYGFKGIPDNVFNTLLGVLEKWNSIDAMNTQTVEALTNNIINNTNYPLNSIRFVSGIFNYDNLPPISFYVYINKVNDLMIAEQIANIEYTLDIIINRRYMDRGWLNDTIYSQNSNAIQWLNKYHLINRT